MTERTLVPDTFDGTEYCGLVRRCGVERHSSYASWLSSRCQHAKVTVAFQDAVKLLGCTSSLRANSGRAHVNTLGRPTIWIWGWSVCPAPYAITIVVISGVAGVRVAKPSSHRYGLERLRQPSRNLRRAAKWPRVEGPNSSPIRRTSCWRFQRLESYELTLHFPSERRTPPEGLGRPFATEGYRFSFHIFAGDKRRSG